MASAKEEFVGTRARLQRLNDAKMFNGWIEAFFGEHLRITITSNRPISLGERFHIEAIGARGTMSCQVEVVDYESGVPNSVSETAAVAVTMNLGLRLLTPMLVRASVEEVRYKLNELQFCFDFEGEMVSAVAIDGSAGGIGAFSQVELPTGLRTSVLIPTNHGEIRATVEVRYCRPDARKKNLRRLGLKFVDLDRLSRTKWEQFLREAA